MGRLNISLDCTSIGAFRIALAVVLIIDLVINRFPSATELYSDSGYLTTNALLMYPRTTGITPLYFITSELGVKLFFLLYFLLSVMLLVGYQTRIISILVFICLFSIQDRVLPFIYAADDVLRITAFWAMFLPLESSFSLFEKSAKEKNSSFNNVVSFSILLQISIIYLFNALFKSGEMWQNGTAVSYAVSILDHKTRFSHLFYNNNFLPGLFTYSTKLFQYSIIFLLFMPFYKDKLRFLAFLMIILFHFGLAIFLDVGIFYLTVLPFAILILPENFWNKLKNFLNDKKN